MDKSGHQELRRRAAKLAAAAETLKRKSGAGAPFNLAFMTDRRRVSDPLSVVNALPKGAAVILRDYDLLERAALASELAGLCAHREVSLLIGADPAIARQVGAKGVHLPSWFRVRNELPKNMIISAACHGAADLQKAAASGADIAFLSPVFATKSHPDAPALGPLRFRQLAARSPLPVLALGGVMEKNANRLAGPNVAGLAAIGAFTD